MIQDPATKLFHLYFSEMRVGGLHTFSQPGHCQLTTAASTSPLGPFSMQRTVRVCAAPLSLALSRSLSLCVCVCVCVC
eukprot:COSAG03_NODE_18625_length_351_cov_0.984127_1_plen_77_part_10